MATKPTEIINFEPTGTAVDTIPSGKQAAGWRPGERPPAQFRNWMDRAFSRLYNYVLDGALSGNHTIAGTLGVTGAVGLSDTLTMATNKNVVLSGTGRVVDAWERTERFHASAMVASSGGLNNLEGWTIGSDGITPYYSVRVPVGATITGFGCDITQDITGSSTFAMRLSRLMVVSGSWTSGTLDDTPATSAGSGAKSIAISGLSRSVSSSEYYVIYPIIVSGTGTSRIHGGYITWRP